MHPMRRIVEMFFQEHKDHHRTQRDVNDKILTELAYIKRRVDMTDANLDAIAQDWPALKNAILYENKRIADLALQLKNVNPEDPRADAIHTDMQTALAAIKTAIGGDIPAADASAAAPAAQAAPAATPADTSASDVAAKDAPKAAADDATKA